MRALIALWLNATMAASLDDLLGPTWSLYSVPRILEHWVLHEIEFYLNAKCSGTRINLKANRRKISAFPKFKNVAQYSSDYAVDDDLSTTYISNCQRAMGGCRAMSMYFGATFDFDDSYRHWRAKNNLTHFKVWPGPQCIRLYQSADYTKSTDHLVLYQYVINSQFYPEWLSRQSFEGLRGGIWQQRPSIPLSIWIVKNMDTTETPWEVQEIEFFADVVCSESSSDAVVVSSAASLIPSNFTHPEDFAAVHRASDGDLSTSFVADCSNSEAPNSGCSPEDAWLGFDFGLRGGSVRCFRIFQKPGAHSTRLRVYRWDGSEFANPWEGNPWIVEPNDLFPGYSGVPGQWANTRPQLNAVYKLEPTIDGGVGGWKVYELLVYNNRECDGQPMKGDPFSSSSMAGHEARFLTDTVEATFWQARCRVQSSAALWDEYLTRKLENADFASVWQLLRRTEQTAQKDAWILAEQARLDAAGDCLPDRSWIAVDFERVSRNLLCFKILQTYDVRMLARDIALYSWSGLDWKLDAEFTAIGGGTWNKRPAVPSSLWIIANKGWVRSRWAVAELEMSPDVYCADPMIANAIASDAFGGYAVRSAFDKNSATMWESACDNCEPFAAWLGWDTTYVVDIKCVRIFQHPHPEKAADTLSLMKWEGGKFREAMSLDEIGGGYFHRRPAGLATLWRVKRPSDEAIMTSRSVEKEPFNAIRNLNDSNGARRHLGDNDTSSQEMVGTQLPGMPSTWEVKEVRFYTNAACTIELKCASVIGPYGAYPMISDYNMMETKKGSGEAADAICDENSGTGLSLRADGWVGIDLRARPEVIRCVEIEQQTGQLHTILELEVWSGTTWTTPSQISIFGATNLLVGLGVGKMKRPAPLFSSWRLSNAFSVLKWTVHELEFFTSCSSRVGCGLANTALQGSTIASGSYTEQRGGTNIRPYEEDKAFDKDLTTDWVAQCSPCQPMEAWIGLQLPVSTKVGCIRINQSGLAKERSSSVFLEAWDGKQWAEKAVYHDLGGDSWHYRPRAPNTMWRIVHQSSVTRLKWDKARCRRNDKESCESTVKRQLHHLRAWGVAELQFYHDAYCNGRPMVGRPIVSGSLRGLQGNNIPENAVDGVKQPLGRAWAPSCGVEPRLFGLWAALDTTRVGYWHYNNTLQQMLKLTPQNASTCHAANDYISRNEMCGGEWIGLDFHPEPKEVRCVKIVQSRNDHVQCCDPADEVHLQRWDGTHWTTGWWLHQPKVGSMEPILIQSKFAHLGRCPDIGREKELSQYVEFLPRKLAETCKLPMPGSVQLMGAPQCSRHPDCLRLFRDTGDCCPTADAYLYRCCCKYLYNSNEVFEDEYVEQHDIDLEFVLISSTNMLPFVFLACSVLHWWLVFTNFNPRKLPALAKLKVSVCDAMNGSSIPQYYLRWVLIRRRGRDRRYWLRLGVHFLVSALAGGACLSILFALGLGFGVLHIMMRATMVVKFGVSPFDMKSFRERCLRSAIIVSKIRSVEDMETAGRFGMQSCMAFFMGLAYFAKFVVDFALMFTVYVSLGWLHTPGNPRVLGHEDIFNLQVFPSFFEPFGSTLDFAVATIKFANEALGAFIGFSIGIPRCEGPTLLLASVFTIGLSIPIILWIVNDFFGIYAGSLQAVKSCRPRCQAGLLTGVLFLGRGCIFVVVQSLMLVLQRTFSMATPSVVRWMCPRNDISSQIVGRILLTTSVLIAIPALVLTADGHLTGSHFFMSRLAKKLKFNLSDLDPDYDPKDTSQCFKIKFSNWGCFLPTTLGLWYDDWNVKGYLIKERSVVYAAQFNDPQPCIECGELHVPYKEIIKATAKQVSLAWQVVPVFGMPVGKLCEYLNEPATYYTGNQLICYKTRSWHRQRRLSQAEYSQTLMNKARFATFPPYVRRRIHASRAAETFGSYILPWLQRLFALFLASLVILAPASLRPENVTETARTIVRLAFWVSLVKGQLDYAIPSLVLTIMASAITAVNQSNIDDVVGRRKGIFLTQVVHGTFLGSFVAVMVVSDSALVVWSYSLLPSLVSVIAICVAWNAIQTKRQTVEVSQKIVVVALGVLIMIAVSWKSQLSTGEVTSLIIVYACASMTFVLLVLRREDEFPCQELSADPLYTKLRHFMVFFREVFMTRHILAPYVSIFCALGISMLLDQYVACSDSLVKIVDDAVLEEITSAQFIGLYCRGPTDWTQFSRVCMHWFCSPLIAVVVSLAMDSLVGDFPLICSVCIGGLGSILTCVVFMSANISFTYYISAFVFVCAISLGIGAFLEMQKASWVRATVPIVAELDEAVMKPKLRPWERDDFEHQGMQEIEKLLIVQNALQDARIWKAEGQRDFLTESKDKVTSLGQSVRHTLPHMNLKDNENALHKDRPLAINENRSNEMLMPTLGSPTHSAEVVQGVQAWRRQANEWREGIPPPRRIEGCLE